MLLFAAGMMQPAFAQKDDKAIKAAVNKFFDGLENGDTLTLRNACTEAPVLQTYMADSEGKLRVITEDFNELLRFVATSTKDKFDEQIEFEAIHSEQSLASVWTPYKFYLNGKLSHCGTNSFQLVKTPDGWKIQYILDTRRKVCN